MNLESFEEGVTLRSVGRAGVTAGGGARRCGRWSIGFAPERGDVVLE